MNLFCRRTVGLALILFAGSSLTGTGDAATLTVTNTNNSGPGSLRQAIIDANNVAGDDTVVFDLPVGIERVIRLTSMGISVTSNVTVLNDRAGDVPVAIEVVKQLNFLYPCFSNDATGSRLLLSGLILRGGTQSGVRNSNGYLELRNCTISGNSSFFGGGVYIHGGQAVLTNCMISGNQASGQGGGLYNEGGTVTLQHCTISKNVGVISGGGIQNWGVGYLSYLGLVDCLVASNSTTSSSDDRGGAGLNNNGGLVGMTNCTFSDNLVQTYGTGAVFTTGGLVANNCTFVNNQGPSAGAIFDYGSARQTFLNNCTFTNNGTAVVANYQYVNGTPPRKPKLWIDNCTFAENPGFALWAAGGSNTTVDVANTIFKRGGTSANILATNDIFFLGTTAVVTSRGHNLSDDAAGGDGGTGPGGYLNGPGDIRNTDPHLGPLADNGGPTKTYPLLPGSPAIDAGDNATATPRDQRGLVRLGNRDIGSFELDGTISTTRLANISTRARCLTKDNVLIAGFIITGQDNKKVIVRAIGPSLAIASHLNDPTLQLFDAAGQVIASNDNWNDAPNRQEIIDSSLAPAHDRESAILTSLAPGAYTAVVSGAANSTGIAVVEAYDLDPAANSRFANIATRSLVQTGDDVMIGGLIVAGPDNQTILVRALGPSIPVTKPLADPELDLFDSNGNTLARNSNWSEAPDPVAYQTDAEVKVLASGLPPGNSLECALVITLTAGQYTAIVSGADNSTGVGLVEVYALQ